MQGTKKDQNTTLVVTIQGQEKNKQTNITKSDQQLELSDKYDRALRTSKQK